jgi:hypothetical protein
MQIVMKLSEARLPDADKLVREVLGRVFSVSAAQRATLAPVFPSVTTGRRAGMMVLSLDDDTPPAQVSKLLDLLRSSKAIEYAEPAAARSPVGR